MTLELALIKRGFLWLLVKICMNTIIVVYLIGTPKSVAVTVPWSFIYFFVFHVRFFEKEGEEGFIMDFKFNAMVYP